MPAYYGQLNTSCALDRCLARVHDMIDWDNKYPCRDMGNGKIRAVGMGMAMQGSGITSMDAPGQCDAQAIPTPPIVLEHTS